MKTTKNKNLTCHLDTIYIFRSNLDSKKKYVQNTFNEINLNPHGTFRMNVIGVSVTKGQHQRRKKFNLLKS